MIVLAIDTALDCCSAAVFDTDRDEAVALESLPMNRGHAEALMPLIGRVMEKAGMTFQELDRIAVTTGPGSFTGLRVGISAARGLGLAADKPVVGVTTLAAFIAPLMNEHKEQPVLAAIDARHDHVYFQGVTGNGAMLIKAGVIPIADTLSAARYGPVRIVGNAAQMLADRWPDHTPPALVDQKPAPDICWVAWMGAAANPENAPAKPFYLRAPDAKPKINSKVTSKRDALQRSPAS